MVQDGSDVRSTQAVFMRWLRVSLGHGLVFLYVCIICASARGLHGVMCN